MKLRAWLRGVQGGGIATLASLALLAGSACDGLPGASNTPVEEDGSASKGQSSESDDADPSQSPEPSPDADESPEDSPDDASKESETGSTPEPDDDEDTPDDGEDPSEDSPDESDATGSTGSGSTSEGDSETDSSTGTGSDSTSTSDATSSDSSSGSGSTQDPGGSGGGQPKRDCDKVSWGSSNIIKVGDILQRGDTPGYVDSNGDNKPEEVRRTAGMCELHLTGRKCGLVLYGAD